MLDNQAREVLPAEDRKGKLRSFGEGSLNWGKKGKPTLKQVTILRKEGLRGGAVKA